MMIWNCIIRRCRMHRVVIFDISRTKRKNCPVKDRDEDKDFYIRAINPDTIEYGIGEICEDGVFDEKTIKVIGEIQFAL